VTWWEWLLIVLFAWVAGGLIVALAFGHLVWKDEDWHELDERAAESSARPLGNVTVLRRNGDLH